MQYIFKQEVDWRLFRAERESKSMKVPSIMNCAKGYLTVTLLKRLGHTLRSAAALEGELYVNVCTRALSAVYPLLSTEECPAL